jgi:biotin transport system substrate-specific component
MRQKSRGIPASAALACLFSALCAAGAYISIPLPIGPVPLALSNFFAILGGLLLGPLWGAVSSFAYIGIGALGFPVFSGGRGGFAHIAGPTGGYLMGYALGAALAGLLARRRGWAGSILGSLVGFASILGLGVCALKWINGVSWSGALAVGLLPFLPGDAIKAGLAALVCRRLGPFVDSLTGARSVRNPD